jgi:hypothetical protein
MAAVATAKRAAFSTRAVGLVVVLTLAACASGTGGNDASDSSAQKTHRFNTGEFTEGEIQYGLAPSRGRGVTFQPDVVIVEGGARSVHSVSTDGLVWTIDGGARGVKDLEPGKIMFVTSNGLGRVLRVDPVGPDVDVLLGPVNLTDVVRDGTFSVDQPLDFDNVALLNTPDQPGIVTDPSLDPPTGDAPSATGIDTGDPSAPDATGSAARTIRVPPIRLMAASGADNVPRIGFGDAYQVQIGPVSVKGGISTAAGLFLQLGLSGSSGVKGSVVFQLKWKDPKIKSNTVIENGEIKKAEFTIEGIHEVDVKVQAGSKNGSDDNLKTRIEVPIEFAWPLPPFAGMPFAMLIRNKFILDTAFSSKNGTITGDGAWNVNGPIGAKIEGDSTTSSTPTITVKKSIVDSLGGISVGVEGLVFSYQMKVIVGAGITAFVVGPHLGLTFSIGMTRGSSAGVILVCRGATLDIKMNTGMGFKIDFKKIAAIKDYAHHDAPSWLKLEGDFFDVSISLFHRDVTQPAVSLCTGGANGA